MKVIYNKETKEISLVGSRADMTRLAAITVKHFINTEAMLMLGIAVATVTSMELIDETFAELERLYTKNLPMIEQHRLMKAALEMHRLIASCRLEDGDSLKDILGQETNKEEKVFNE